MLDQLPQLLVALLRDMAARAFGSHFQGEDTFHTEPFIEAEDPNEA